MEKFSLKFTKRNFFFLGICFGGLILIVLASILPLIAQKKELIDQVPQIESKINSQKQIAELNKSIDKKLTELEKLKSLPEISYTSLDIKESSEVANEIKELAIKEKLEVVKIKAIMPKSSINLKKISFRSTVEGPLVNIRAFMFSLLQVPYVERIEKFNIKTNENYMRMDLFFSVRLK